MTTNKIIVGKVSSGKTVTIIAATTCTKQLKEVFTVEDCKEMKVFPFFEAKKE